MIIIIIKFLISLVVFWPWGQQLWRDVCVAVISVIVVDV